MEKEKKSKIIIFIVIIVSLLVLVGVSYALARLTLTGKKNILMTVQDVTLTLTEDSSSGISIHGGLPMSEAEGKAQTNAYKFVLNNTGNSSVTYDLYLENDSEAKTACGNCDLIDNNYISYELKKEGSVVKTGVTNPTSPVISGVSIKAGEQQAYELRVWLNLSADNSAMEKYYFGRIKLDATQALADSLAKRLVEDYTNSDTLTAYTDGDKSKMYTFHQTAGEQQAGYTAEELTEYRYIGDVPNNYIKFNDELWRIIGVFTVEDETGKKEQRVKIRRHESIGNYSWDNTTVEGSDGKNRWSDARLTKVLNPGFENDADSGGSSYWNRQNSTCYLGTGANATADCNFATTGLSEKAKKMIGKTKWYLGGFQTNGQSTLKYYADERGSDIIGTDLYPREISWLGYIGLLYPSDYGFTFSMGVHSCFNDLRYCRDSEGGVPTKSWIYNKNNEWTISTSFMGGSTAYFITIRGEVGGYAVNNKYGSYTTRPALYLKSSVKLSGGTGTSSDPFVIG